MNKLLFITLPFMALALPFTVKCQTIDTARFQQVMKVSVTPGQSTLQLPLYDGRRVILKGTDRQPVIDINGRITTPLQDAMVQLYLVMEGSLQELPNLAVTVPGKNAPQGNPQPFVIPSLREWAGGKGTFSLSAKSRIVVDPAFQQELKEAAKLTAEDVKLTTGLALKQVTGKPAKGDVYLSLACDDHSLGKEGYLFDVKEYVSITASKYEGVFAGTRTLLQLLSQDRQIPVGFARDYPKYELRGFVLDAGRKFFTLEFLQNYVRFMSYYKMNDFHIHLNDNGFKKFFNDNWDSTYSAFRLENSKYPGLTAKDGHYTKQEFIDLQKMAKAYGIRIIPEIDVPAHSLAIAKAVPAIGSKDYGMDHLDLHNPLTYEVVENIFAEYLSGPNPVFIGDEVHIGTDEYAKKEAEPFRKFTDHFIRYVEGYGKKVRFWGSLTHAKGTTPVRNKGVTINAWYNGYADPREMAKEGYDLISTPDGWLYIVPAAGYYYDYLNTKRLYTKWEPNMIGDQTFAYGHPQIRGGSFAVWNDHSGNGITEYDVHHRVFPAMQTLAEKMWAGSDTTVSYDVFMAKGSKLLTAPGLFMGKGLSTWKIGNSVNAVIKDKAMQLRGGKSYFVSNLSGAGYDYAVEFDVKPEGKQLPGAVLFSSPYATLKLMQEGTDKLGFSREGYNDHFNYTVPSDVWTHIKITGDRKGTTLYVNGVKQDDLRGQQHSFSNTKDKIARMQTLYFPLQRVGDEKNAFKGWIRDIKVSNQ